MPESALCPKTKKQVGIHGPKRYHFLDLMPFVRRTLTQENFIYEAFNYTEAFLFQKPHMKIVNGMDSE